MKYLSLDHHIWRIGSDLRASVELICLPPAQQSQELGVWFSAPLSSSLILLMIIVSIQVTSLLKGLEYLLEVGRLKLHRLRKSALFEDLLLEVLVNLVVHAVRPQRPFGSGHRISLPHELLLLVAPFLLFFSVLAVNTKAKLPAPDVLLETQTVFFLALGFLACAEGQLLQVGVVGANTFKIMHIFTSLLFQMGHDPLSFLGCPSSLFLLQLPPPLGPQELIFSVDAESTALSSNADFPWSEIAATVSSIAVLSKAAAFVSDLKTCFPIDVLLSNAGSD